MIHSSQNVNQEQDANNPETSIHKSLKTFVFKITRGNLPWRNKIGYRVQMNLFWKPLKFFFPPQKQRFVNGISVSA